MNWEKVTDFYWKFPFTCACGSTQEVELMLIGDLEFEECTKKYITCGKCKAEITIKLESYATPEAERRVQ